MPQKSTKIQRKISTWRNYRGRTFFWSFCVRRGRGFNAKRLILHRKRMLKQKASVAQVVWNEKRERLKEREKDEKKSVKSATLLGNRGLRVKKNVFSAHCDLVAVLKANLRTRPARELSRYWPVQRRANKFISERWCGLFSLFVFLTFFFLLLQLCDLSEEMEVERINVRRKWKVNSLPSSHKICDIFFSCSALEVRGIMASYYEYC